MGELMATVRDAMGPSYPELVTDFDRIQRIAVAEETAFNRTLASGSRLFEDAAGATRSAGATVLSGTDAFTLHDTYGFPIELTLEMAAEAGLSVDEEGFRGLMAEQRQRAKADAAARKQAHADLSAYRELVDAGPTEFTGFDELTSEARILGIFVDGKRVPVVGHGGAGSRPRRAGARPQPVLRGVRWTDRRRGHHHRRRASAAAKAAVNDVQKIAKTLWAHRVNVESGEFVEGDTVRGDRRSEMAPRRDPGPLGHAHGARRASAGAGPERRSGRIAEPARLPAVRLQLAGRRCREDQRTQIEEVTNEAVEADFEVHSFTTDLEKAKAMGAMALFGEAYPDEVRVVEIGGPFSLELCGGTHVHNSAQIGPVTILGESSVGSGIRRVEAYVGLDSFRHLAKERALMAGLASSLKVPSDEVPARVANLVERLRVAEKELDRMRLANARAAAANAAAGARTDR